MNRKLLAVERLERRLLLSFTLDPAPLAEPAPRLDLELGPTVLADVQKLIVAGDPNGIPPDSPAARVDANSTDSPYAGVGSLEIRSGNSTYLCTASVIGRQHVLTAGHCLDLNNNGGIDVGPADVTFHLNFGGDLTQSLSADALYVHPDFTGFANPAVNDDVAVVRLSAPIPEGVPVYTLNTDPATAGQQITMTGYGQSGDGVSGYYVGANFSVKRTGANRTDDFDLDDEGSGQTEVFIADFDGPTSSTNYLGGLTLGNNIEATLGGGDSGGPSFIDQGAGLELYGINTFTTRFRQFFFLLGPAAPLFGSGFGGIAVAPYAEWITSIVGTGSGDALPSVELTSPAENATVQGVVNVTANAGDDLGVTQVEFFVDEASIGVDTDGSNGWSAVWDTMASIDGNHVVKAVATDTAGQKSADGVVVNVDNVVEPVLLYFSLGTSATFNGLSVARDDIVAWDGAQFSLVFDGSDVGLTDPYGTLTIDAFAVISPTELLLSFAEPGGILGFGSFDDSDIVKFTASSWGQNTAGTWSIFLDGSDVGLTTTSEDIDAIELLPDGRLLVSTTGSISVSGASGTGQDLLVFSPRTLGVNTSGSWSLYFDGSDVGLSSSSENVDGAAVGAGGEIYLSTSGNFSVSGVSGANEDVFVFRPTRTGSVTQGKYDATLYFDGSAVGLQSLDLKAIDVPGITLSTASPNRTTPSRGTVAPIVHSLERFHSAALASVLARWGTDTVRETSLQRAAVTLEQPRTQPDSQRQKSSDGQPINTTQPAPIRAAVDAIFAKWDDRGDLALLSLTTLPGADDMLAAVL